MPPDFLPVFQTSFEKEFSDRLFGGSMNPLLKQIYQTQQVEDGEGNLINPFPVAIPYETGSALYDTIHKYKLENTLEIGMAYGLSTLFICQAHHDRGTGQHIAIDPFQRKPWKSIGLLNVERTHLSDHFHFIDAPSSQALPALVQEGKRLDFAFIDGAHWFDYVLVDFFYVDQLLNVGGYIVFDDLWMPGIRKVISFVLRNRQYELVTMELKTNVFKRMGKMVQNFSRNPEIRTAKLGLIPGNICLLRKISADQRDWTFHRSF